MAKGALELLNYTFLLHSFVSFNLKVLNWILPTINEFERTSLLGMLVSTASVIFSLVTGVSKNSILPIVR